MAGAIGDAHLVVNATSVGMGGGAGPIDADLLGAGQVVADLVYEPVRTALLDGAAAAGCRTVDGLGMLVHQAAIAFEAWTGETAPLAAMRGAITAHRPRSGHFRLFLRIRVSLPIHRASEHGSDGYGGR